MNHDTNWANDEKSEGQNEKRATENEIYSYIIYLFFILNSKSKNIYVQSTNRAVVCHLSILLYL